MIVMNALMPEQFEDKYASLSAALRPGHIFCVYNAQGHMVFLSPTVQELLGYSVEDFKENHWAHMVENEMSDQAEEYLSQTLEGQAAPSHTILFEHRNGGRILMEAQHWPVFDDRGQVSRIEGYLRDLSAHF